MIPANECKARDKATCRYHKHTAEEIQAQKLAADFGVQPRVAIKVAKTFTTREEAEKAQFKQEWRERMPNWKNLGFQYPVSRRKFTRDQEREALMGTDAVLGELTEAQRGALRFFASNNYRWVNPALYGTRELADRADSRSILDYNMAHMANHDVVEDPTLAQLGETTSLLDTALNYERDEARVIYRGVAIKNTTPGAVSVEDLHAYVDETYKVNSVVDFKGYLSATANPKVALGYSTTSTGMGNREGIFFELLTKKGVSLGNIALYTREDETLLPRNTKWRVAAVHKSRPVKYELQGSLDWMTTRNQGTATIIQLVEIEA